MKKVFVFCLVLMLVLLSACGSQTGVSKEDAASEGSKKEEKIKLTFWHIETGETSKAVIDAAVKRFEEKHPGVEVEAVAQQNDPYKTKLSVAMGGGTPPDLFHSWGGGWLQQFVEAGQVLDLTDKINQDDFVSTAFSLSTFDGKIYGAPLSVSFVPVWYNKEIFAKYGLEPPETYAELLDIVRVLKENDVIPFALANKTKWTGSFYFMYLADRLGGADLFDEAFNRTGRTFDDPAYVKAGEMVQQLVEMEAFPKGFNGMDYDTGQSRQLLYTGKAGMQVMGTWLMKNIRGEAPEMEEKLGIFPFPAIEGGEGDPSNVIGGISPTYSIAAKTQHPDLAVELLKELTSKETAKHWNENTGYIPMAKGVEVSDPFTLRAMEILDDANHLQLYYDQTLPPELAELHKDTTQALFGLVMTPEEAAQKMEEAAQQALE